jgi:hypothetical protein
MMDQTLSAAAERASLAAADLVVAANHAIALRTMKPEKVRDDVDASVLSRRFTSYATARTLDEARDDLGFASQAMAEIGRISASADSPTTDREEAVTAELAFIARLTVLAAECERRAAALRS